MNNLLVNEKRMKRKKDKMGNGKKIKMKKKKIRNNN